MKIKELKQFIQEANPEIIAMTDDQLQLQGLANYFHEAGHSEALRAVNMACDKPGRPITLADVLLAMKKRKEWEIGGWTIRDDHNIKWLLQLWDLKQDIDNQNNETKLFLIDLLIN